MRAAGGTSAMMMFWAATDPTLLTVSSNATPPAHPVVRGAVFTTSITVGGGGAAEPGARRGRAVASPARGGSAPCTFEYSPGLMVSLATFGVVRRIVRACASGPGAFVEQEMSTNSYPGFRSSASVTVLVASALVGFHWKVAMPSVSVVRDRGPVAGGGNRLKPRVAAGIGDTVAVNRPESGRNWPSPTEQLGDGHGRLAELDDDLAEPLGQVVEVLHERVVGPPERRRRYWSNPETAVSRRALSGFVTAAPTPSAKTCEPCSLTRSA